MEAAGWHVLTWTDRRGEGRSLEYHGTAARVLEFVKLLWCEYGAFGPVKWRRAT